MLFHVILFLPDVILMLLLFYPTLIYFITLKNIRLGENKRSHDGGTKPICCLPFHLVGLLFCFHGSSSRLPFPGKGSQYYKHCKVRPSWGESPSRNQCGTKTNQHNKPGTHHRLCSCTTWDGHHHCHPWTKLLKVCNKIAYGHMHMYWISIHMWSKMILCEVS